MERARPVTSEVTTNAYWCRPALLVAFFKDQHQLSIISKISLHERARRYSCGIRALQKMYKKADAQASKDFKRIPLTPIRISMPPQMTAPKRATRRRCVAGISEVITARKDSMRVLRN
eukprot:1634141-Pleurochrysis_carterae.AAC.1